MRVIDERADALGALWAEASGQCCRFDARSVAALTPLSTSPRRSALMSYGRAGVSA